EEVLRKLDEDLGLGLEGDTALPSLFQTRDSVRRFAEELEGSMKGAGPRDRMDMGIAFLEMDLPEIAVLQFAAAAGDPALRLGATCLMATAHLASGRPLEAVMVLEPMLTDQEIARAEKLDLIYVMGRAQEALGRREEA